MKKIGISLLFLIVCISSYADQMINVKCVKVSDGDTITVLQWNKEYKVRLYGYIVELGNATIPCGAWGVDATRTDQAKALVLNGVFNPVQERLLTVEARGCMGILWS